MGSINFNKTFTNKAILFVLLLSIVICFKLLQEKSYKHRLFTYYNKGFLGVIVKHTGFLPIKYYNDVFCEDIVQEKPTIILISHKDSGFFQNAVFIDKNGKGHLLNTYANINNSSQPKCLNDLTLLFFKSFNVKSFNMYLKESGVNDCKFAINEYCKILQWCYSDTRFKWIKDPISFKNFYNEKREAFLLENNILVDRSLLIHEDYGANINMLDDDTIIIWVELIGVVEVTFSFNNDCTIKSIRPRFIGQTGTESIY